MRDKLINILCAFDGIDKSCCFKTADCRPCEELADFLIAYGVTVGDVPDIYFGKWFPVSERLPDSNGVYLSVDDMGIYSFRVFDPSKRMWKAIWEDEKVTHWMPMPEAPKE